MLLFLFIFLLITTPVSADGFDIIYNSSFNQYRQTTGISYSDIPQSKESFEPGLSYDISLVEGVKTDDVWGNYTLESLTENNYWQRRRDLLSKVSGPPGTQLDLLYYYLNNTGHSIEVNRILLPFSRGDSSLGNWMNVIAGNSGVLYRDISISWEQLVLSRKGIMKEYVGPGRMDNGIGGSSIMDSFVIKDPINIEEIEMLVNGQEIRMEIVLRNLKDEDLENIEITHGGFNSLFIIPATETVEIQYVLESDEWTSMLTISNPNSDRECILYGNSLTDWTTTDAITALAFREDGGWVNSSYFKPEGEDFCITQIPYSVNIPLIKPQLEELEDEISEEMDEDSEGTLKEDSVVLTDSNDLDSDDLVREEAVLGVQATPSEDLIKDNNFVLPKTGVVIY
ncbi:MAG: hypothetical protein XD87_0002 [candidate division WS6 bacterium 36_33]|uniref:Transmembrane(S)protein n=1 Tax=candidate division WS6 bacterium 36_33 TaxID=1641388 RepID=A0A101GZN1_9BACT|nr:MAG: hypothetical protein XD87_0002 [candidate division WS6 bacterium 36_33]